MTVLSSSSNTRTVWYPIRLPDMTNRSPSSFVPVDRERAASLLADVRAAANAQRKAIAALLELSEDLRADAVARLRERGASEAQIERYEASFVREREAVHAAGRGFDVALRALDQELADV